MTKELFQAAEAVAWGACGAHPFYALDHSPGGEIYAGDASEAERESEPAITAAGRMADIVERGITDRTVDAYDDFFAGGVGMMIMAN